MTVSNNDQKVGLIVEAQDKASATLKKIGGTATSSFSLVGEGAKKASGMIKSMPEQFGKASTAMLLFQNSTAQMGGKAADAANKLTAVAGLVATGGPIGIGLAAATLAITAGSAAWDVYTMATRNAEAAQRSIDKVLAQQHDRMTTQKKSADDVEKAVKEFGKTADQVAMEDLESLIQKSEESTAALDEQRIALFYNGHAFREMDAATKQHHDNLQRIVEQTKKMNEDRKREAAARRELAKLQRDKDEADKREQAAMSRATQRRSEALATLKQEQKALIQASENGKITAQSEDIYATKVERAIAILEKKTAITKRDYEIVMNAARDSAAAREIENEQAEEALKFLHKKQDAIDAFVAKRAADAAKQLKLDEHVSEQAQSEIDQKKEMMEALAQQAKITGEQMASSLAQGLVRAALDSENAGDIIKNTLINSAQSAVMSYAASGAAAAAFSQAGIPILGPILAASASGLVFGMIKKYLNMIPGAADGYRVYGGIPGVDSVPIMAQQGEAVYTKRQVNLIDRMVVQLEKSGGASGSGTHIHLHESNTVSSRTADAERKVREMGRIVKRLQRRRMWAGGRV